MTTIHLRPAARFRRRGTVLVLVLGALALLSVITIVYVSIGRGDRRSAGVVVRQAETRDASASLRDYIASVVADDVVSTAVDGYEATADPSTLTPVLVRKGFNHPSTDPFRRSTLGSLIDLDNVRISFERRFNPTGSYADPHTAYRRLPTGQGAGVGALTTDPRVPSSPWLADTGPSWLRQGLVDGPIRWRQDPQFGYLFHRDWAHISNVAPDGRFVNLWNLAPVVADAATGRRRRVSGFDALSYVPVAGGAVNGATNDADRYATAWRTAAPTDATWRNALGAPYELTDGRVGSFMSYGLTLMDPSLPVLASNVSAGTARPEMDLDEPGPAGPRVRLRPQTLVQQLPAGAGSTPAYDLQLRYAPGLPFPERLLPTAPGAAWAAPANFAPGSPLFDALRADPNVPAHWTTHQVNAVRPINEPGPGPDAPEYLAYQWADADGDGYADSRWFELIDGAIPTDIRPLVPSDGRFRWFAAVRIVDLSALVNVNTAGELRRPARQRVRALGAANRPDNDRLQVTSQATPLGASPADIDLRRLLTLNDAYAQYGATEPGVTSGGYSELAIPNQPAGAFADDYTLMRNYTLRVLDAGGNPRFLPNPPGGDSAQILGDRAYAALQLAFTPASAGVPDRARDLDWTSYAAATTGDDARTAYAIRPAPADLRYRRYRDAASSGLGALTASASESTLTTGTRLGNDDLLELLTWRTANSPTTSRLERILDSRGGYTNTLRALGPMRSERPLSLELLTEASFPLNNDPADTARRQAAYVAGMARLAFDVRQRLTTVSGARLLRPGLTLATPARGPGNAAQSDLGTLGPADAKLDASDALFRATRLSTGLEFARGVPVRDPSRLFLGYADALLPHTGRLWRPRTGGFQGSGATASRPIAWDVAYPYPTLAGASPAATLTNTTNVNAPRPESTATMHYAGNRGPIARWGPELALRLAAHLTANTIDAHDEDRPRREQGQTPGVLTTSAQPSSTNPTQQSWPDLHIPTALTLLIDAGKRAEITRSGTFTLNAEGVQPEADLDDRFPWVAYAARRNAAPDLMPVPASDWNPRPGLIDLDADPLQLMPTTAINGRRLEPRLVRQRLARSYPEPGDVGAQNPPATSTVGWGGTASRAGAINVFGIEPQPFLVQATSLALYRAQRPAATPPNPIQPFFTVDTTANATNDDFAGHILCFVLANPFDVEVTVSRGGGSTASGNEWTEYYIEYNGAIFTLRDDAVSASGATPIRIPARSSRVFYAFSLSATRMNEQLFGVSLPAGESVDTFVKRLVGWSATATPGTTGYAGAAVEPVRIPRFGVTPALAGSTLNPGDPVAIDADFFADRTGLTPWQQRESKGNVHLWRTLRSTIDAPADSSNGALNRRSNDLLADTLRDPAIDVTTPAAVTQLTLDRNAGTGTIDFDAPSTETGTHVAFALSGTIRRAAMRSTGAPAGTVDASTWVGGIRGYMIEPKQDPAAAPTAGGGQGLTPRDWASIPNAKFRRVIPYSDSGVPDTDFLGTDARAYFANSFDSALSDLRDAIAGNGTVAPTDPVSDSLRQPAEDWTSEPGPSAGGIATVLGVNLDGRTLDQAIGEFPQILRSRLVEAWRTNTEFQTALTALSSSNAATGNAIRQKLLELERSLVNPGLLRPSLTPPVETGGQPAVELVRPLRVQDLLSQLAVGPEYDPPPLNGTAFEDDQLRPDEQSTSLDPVPARHRWITLSQALAIALNYSSPPDADPAEPNNPAAVPDSATDFQTSSTGGFAENLSRVDFTIYARLGDWRPPPGTPNAPIANPVNAPPGAASTIALDRGMLILDRFAPFEDRDIRGVVNVSASPAVSARRAGTFTGGAGLTDPQDAKRWPGIPLALNVFNVFDTRSDASPSAAIAGAGTVASGNVQPAALTTRVEGLININTAPLPVLRLIPMLSPTTEYADPVINGYPYTWGIDPLVSGGGPIGPGGGTRLSWIDMAQGIPTDPAAPNPRRLPTPAFDVAAAVAAYRDRTGAWTRPLDPDPATGRIASNNAALRPARFSDSTPLPSAVTDNALINPEAPPINRGGALFAWTGRRDTTFIEGLREAPGFVGTGEILAATDRTVNRTPANPRGQATLGLPAARVPLNAQADGPAFDATGAGLSNRVPSGVLGTNTTSYATNPQNQTPTAADLASVNPAQVPDSPIERFVAAAGALNTTTTRSDVFVAWFIIHGYQRSDTENLRLTDPLVPSVARRFVMVIDRSNVTRRGDKPRILMVEELPLIPPG